MHVRCYLVVEHHADLTPLRDVLSELGVDVVTPSRAFTAPADADLSRWVPEVDFVLAVFPEGAGWETPPALYLDLGVAIGSHLPVLIVADPSRRIDASLSPLMAVRAALGNRGALRSRIGQFLRMIGTDRAGGNQTSLPRRRLIDPGELAMFRQALDAVGADYLAQDRTVHKQQGGRARETGQAFDRLVLDLLRAAGAEVDASLPNNHRADAAMYVPGTEDLFREPLYLETKIVNRSVLEQQMLEQIAAYSTARDAAYGVLIWFNPLRGTGDLRHHYTGLYPVLVFNISDLLNRLAHESLAQILRNERNALVHAGRSQ